MHSPLHVRERIHVDGTFSTTDLAIVSDGDIMRGYLPKRLARGTFGLGNISSFMTEQYIHEGSTISLFSEDEGRALRVQLHVQKIDGHNLTRF
jgi:hypothetical protein